MTAKRAPKARTPLPPPFRVERHEPIDAATVARSAVALKAASSARGLVPSDVTIAAWFSDPSESVAVEAALRHKGTRWPLSTAARAARLEAEPDIWTPFAAAVYSYGAVGEPVSARQRPFMAWLRSQTDPEAIRPALALPTAHVRTAIARYAPVWSTALVRDLVQQAGHSVWRFIAENPHLVGEPAEQFVAECWARATGDALGTSWNDRSLAAGAVVRMAARGLRPVPGPLYPHIRRMMDVKADGRGVMELEIVATLFGADTGEYQPTETQWTEIYDGLRDARRPVAQILRHPHCPTFIVLRALEDYQTALVVRNAVAGTPRYLADRAVRRALLSTGSNSQIIPLVKPYAEPGELDEFVARTARTNPHGAARALGRSSTVGPSIGVTSDTVQRLLESRAADAVAALHSFDVRPDAPNTKKPRSR